MMETECCCRICLRAEVGQEMVSVFRKRNNELIATMLMDCGDVLVSKDDAMPGRVCMECLDRLEQAYNLRRLIQKSDSSLRKISKKRVHIKPFFPSIALEKEPEIKCENHDNSDKSKSNILNSDNIKSIIAKDTYTIIHLKGVRCCGCKLLFDSPRLLEQHCAETHHLSAASNSKDTNAFQCSSCLEIFPNRMKLLNHTKTFQSNHIYHCTQCDITFDVEYRLQQHQSLSKAHRNRNQAGETATTAFESLTKVRSKIKRSVWRKRVTRELKYPDQKNIVGIDETAEYQIIHVGGERCCGCELIFASLQELKDHCSEEHHRTDEKGSFECRLCYEKFEQIQSFNRHNTARKHKQLYFCKMCNVVVDVQFRFDQHLKTSVAHKKALAQAGIEPSLLPEECSNEMRTLDSCIIDEEILDFRCCGCNYTCDSREKLEEHSEEIHRATETILDETEPHECTICFKRFSTPELLVYHRNAALQSTVYRCKYCDMQSEIKYRVMQHLASGVHQDFVRMERRVFNAEEKGYICCFVKCTLVFPDSNDLVEHAEAVHASKRRENAEEREHEDFICYVCHKSFRNEKSLYFHQFPRKLDMHCACKDCGATFSNSAALNAHEKTHIGLREFQCDVCGKAFFDEKALRVHKVCHNSERPYVCEVCNKSFLRKGNLKVHKRCHAESIWDCPHCDEKFKTKQSLVLHIRYHTGEKPFQCRYCSNRYSHTTDRQRHEMAAHTKVRPHKCSKCPAAFIRKRQLTMHQRVHTGERPFECDICHKRFMQKNNLAKHLTLHKEREQEKYEETNHSIEVVEVITGDTEYLIEEVLEENGSDDDSSCIENQDEG
ncbi:zinc finger protein 791-like [Sabethes cyaneus]|uniref:zinc finger protein 791-like n=1 Tax=Sabethes cyaneus TaxID=53552 RepID=UPI00237E0B6D|nr:zinc finger protein 791-like [Sabethes cyaneus]XP_053690660.1 zinc finger protein 791-like [Sabethes cyaneus]